MSLIGKRKPKKPGNLVTTLDSKTEICSSSGHLQFEAYLQSFQDVFWWGVERDSLWIAGDVFVQVFGRLQSLRERDEKKRKGKVVDEHSLHGFCYTRHRARLQSKLNILGRLNSKVVPLATNRDFATVVSLAYF